MARPRAASSGPAVAMLFSAWHATTQASQPVHLSRSMTIPQRCDMCLPVRLEFSQRGAVANQLALALADARDLHTRRCPGQRAGFWLDGGRQHFYGIAAASARIARKRLVTLSGR